MASTPATLNDIALRTGVSKAAVAKVILNNRANIRVGKDKAEMIRKVASELGYRPNGLARALRRGKSQVIGVVTGGLDSPYFMEMLKHAEEAASRHGYQVMIIPVEWGEGTEIKALETFFDRRVDGILCMTGVTMREEVSERFRRIPIVPRAGGCSVTQDYLSGMRELFGRLRAAGINRLVYVDNGEVGKKEKAYRDCCAEFAMAAEVVSFEARRPGSLTAAARELAAREDRRFLVCSDHYAIQLIHEFYQLGLRVPDDVRLAGIGGTRTGLYFNPPLASIDQHTAEHVRIEMEMLLEQMGGEVAPRSASLATTFRPGGSFPM